MTTWPPLFRPESDAFETVTEFVHRIHDDPPEWWDDDEDSQPSGIGLNLALTGKNDKEKHGTGLHSGAMSALQGNEAVDG